MLVDKVIKQGIDHYSFYEKLRDLLEEGMAVEFNQDLVDELMRSTIIIHQMSQGVDYKRLSGDNRARCRLGERCSGLGYSDPNPEW
ncbi:uncharacterized protein Bfra_009107 [Botrytis fragariae]|uniref:Uncharacterized protein n=1 Tax=Botrytis fragariae TaxID=1964551 RepID=A0A8H6AQH3_9HELO|nr:uncharacterized protein Bfra_009107 [Botrytis fragariae]KAF5872078.1 hypothetical protein Bfra_009107 [Botrytis fragariae]